MDAPRGTVDALKDGGIGALRARIAEVAPLPADRFKEIRLWDDVYLLSVRIDRKKGTSISIIHTKERGRVREIEKIIGKQFVHGTLPTPHEICSKQLFKAIDEIEKVDVDEDQIAPFMDDINRHFEYFDKEDILKKIVSLEFGKFLKYYANAP